MRESYIPLWTFFGNPIRDIWLHGADPYGQAFHQGRSHTGSCVLAAGILLAVMLLPFLISSCRETMLKVRERYQPAADALGISSGIWWWPTIVLPGSWKNILLSMILAIGRAMGKPWRDDGHWKCKPVSLPAGQSESIAAVIALEMGTAVVGSTHYHALYAAGMVLILLLFLINSGITLLQRKAGAIGRNHRPEP